MKSLPFEEQDWNLVPTLKASLLSIVAISILLHERFYVIFQSHESLAIYRPFFYIISFPVAFNLANNQVGNDDLLKYLPPKSGVIIEDTVKNY